MTGEQETLTAEARVAFQAFQDMSKSKNTYFSLLQEIDEKYKNGGAPSISESLQLEQLLKQHDKNVLAFNTAMAAVEDHDARLQLIQMMS